MCLALKIESSSQEADFEQTRTSGNPIINFGLSPSIFFEDFRTFSERVCVKYRDPGPLRVWKGDSEPQLHPPFSDESNASYANCNKSANSRDLDFEQRSYTLGPLSRKMNNQKLDVVDPSHPLCLPG